MNLTLQSDCLRWARSRAGFTVPILAQKLKLDEEKIHTWEQTGEITWSQVEKLANATHTPIGYLFLPQPPTEKLPIKDFRTVQTLDIAQPSPDLLDTVNAAMRRQDWYRDYVLENGAEPLPFVGSMQVSKDYVSCAELIRAVVKWGPELRDQSSTWEVALSKHIDAVEDADILVMRNGVVGTNNQRPLSVSEFRGFALSDPYAPVIFINGADAKAAQMFTLAHELVHIWLGVSGVSNLNLTYSPDVEAERFCNMVAAELLVPMEELKLVWAENENDLDSIGLIARHFKVSPLVILRRLRDADYIPEDEFQRRYTDELSESRRRAAKKTGGGDFYRTLRTRLSKRFVSALVANTLEGGTPYREAFQLLHVNNAEAVHKLALPSEGMNKLAPSGVVPS